MTKHLLSVLLASTGMVPLWVSAWKKDPAEGLIGVQ